VKYESRENGSAYDRIKGKNGERKSQNTRKEEGGIRRMEKIKRGICTV